MQWAVMSGEVANETFDHLVSDAAGLEKAMDIEQIAGVLTVQSCDQFAAVQLSCGQHRDMNFGGE
jgi:hypothetical protein